MPAVGDQNKPRRLRASAVIMTGALLGVVALLVIRSSEQEQQARERARWEAERKQLNRTLERLEDQVRQLEKSQGKKWLCDRVPCNQGDLVESPRPSPTAPVIDDPNKAPIERRATPPR